jgi:hypothetical protein
VDRKALVIGCPGKPGTDKYLQGVPRDLDNYNRFLRSALGGAWYPHEIETLDDPSAATVRTHIRGVSSADYSFILFSGHGYYSANRRSTIVCLRGDDEMDSTELRAGASKHSLLLDCCRKVDRTVLAEDALRKMDAAARRFGVSNCRRYFNQKIEECPSGLIVLHSCDVNEAAGDDSRRGGYYAYSLIDATETWGDENQTDLTKYFASLTVPSGHDGASDLVRRLSVNRQNPQL